MTIIQITPGAGAMYCGNCVRDNALVAALRRMGHTALMVPLYLPLTLDEADQSAGTPIFFSGINVYLAQQSALFRQAPRWFHNLLNSPQLLKWASGRAASTRPEQLGELTLSMLRGELGNQVRELQELIAWLKTQPKPDVICLSNALLLGMVRRLKSALDVPVVCILQGEDGFLDTLPEPHRTQCWQTMAERAAETDRFIAISRYFGELMGQRLSLPKEKVRVVYNGISVEGYGNDPAAARVSSGEAPTLGYFARMCREKGLDTLVEAYMELRQRDRVKNLRLRIGGSCGPADEPLVESLRERLRENGLLGGVEFCPNLARSEKLSFLRSLTVFSVPARYGEAFGLYVLEALAAGVPVVQPRTAAFPELIEATGGGILCEPGNPQALALAIEELLLDPSRTQALGQAGRRAVFEKFSAETMARATLDLYSDTCRSFNESRTKPPKSLNAPSAEQSRAAST
jgi:glycosyltransferase involved in cell wall biosynthesis